MDNLNGEMHPMEWAGKVKVSDQRCWPWLA